MRSHLALALILLAAAAHAGRAASLERGTGELALARHEPRQAARAASSANGRQVPITVALAVNADSVSATGSGICYHYPLSRARGSAAERWNVSYSAAKERRPVSVVMAATRGAGDGLSPLSLTLVGAGRGTRRVAIGGPHPNDGGSAKVERAGDGWRFTLDLTTRDGATIRGTVTCARTSPTR